MAAAAARVSPSWPGPMLPRLGVQSPASAVGGPSHGDSGYCGRPDSMLCPEPGLEAAGASPVSAALRELLGLTAALRVPWGLASPFFWSWGLDWADFRPMEGLLEPLGLGGSSGFRPRMLQ